jgi:hypothetical protein
LCSCCTVKDIFQGPWNYQIPITNWPGTF